MAFLFLAPSIDPLRGLLLLSLRAARPPRPLPEQRPGHEPPLRRLGAVQGRAHRRRVHAGPLAQHPVRPLHGAGRPDPRHPPGGGRPPQARAASASSRRSSRSTVATSVAVASVLFFVLLNSQNGVLKVNWLNDPDLALFGVSLSSIWQNLGLSFIIVLAGLQTVPDRADGGGDARRLRPGAALLPRHAAADLTGAAVPRRGAGRLRPAGVRPDRAHQPGRPQRRTPRRSSTRSSSARRPTGWARARSWRSACSWSPSS